MNKFVAVILFAILYVAWAEDNGLVYSSQDHDDLETHTDDFVNLSALQYKQILHDFDVQLEEFKEKYLKTLDPVTLTREFVIKSIFKAHEHWKPMLVISDFSKKCIEKHLFKVPTVDFARTTLTKCREDYSVQLPDLLKGAVSVRNSLAHNIQVYYQQVESCGFNMTGNYALCVTSVTEKMTNLINKNQKTFQLQMEAAKCTSTAYVKSAIDCSYTVHLQTRKTIVGVEIAIMSCLAGNEKVCPPCPKNTSAYSYDIEQNSESEILYNPFYGRADNPQCIMLNVNKM